MNALYSTNPNGFCWATGIEDTFVPQSRPGLRPLDEYELTQHYTLWREDLDRAAETGARALRWGIPWHRVQPAPDTWDWRWTDEVFDYMVRVKGLTPIVDLMHYGTPLWLEGSFADPCYPERVAEYAAAVARRYRCLLRYYTPLNEPTINAYMCGSIGWWPPYLNGPQGYYQVLAAVARGMVLTVQALKAEQPDMQTVQVEALGLNYTRAAALRAAVADLNEGQYLGLDLTLGRVDEQHPRYARLLENGVSAALLEWFLQNPVRYDALGVNYYPWSYKEQAARKDGSLYTVRKRGPVHGATLGPVLAEAYKRYGLPVLVTETSAKGDVAERARWMDQTIQAVRDLRQNGVPVVGYTWFPMMTMVDWDYRLGTAPAEDYLLHLGLYDAAFDADGVLQRHATPLVERYQCHQAEPMPHVAAAGHAEAAPAKAGTGPLRPAAAG